MATAHRKMTDSCQENRITRSLKVAKLQYCTNFDCQEHTAKRSLQMIGRLTTGTMLPIDQMCDIEYGKYGKYGV